MQTFVPLRYRLPAVLLLAAALVFAPASPAQGEQDQEHTFRADVNVVNLLFNVKDKRGALIPGLTKEDIEVFEDGAKQNIRYFAAETNLPLTLGMLIDTSGSQMHTLPVEKEVGAAFLREVIREKDLGFIVSFDVQVELLKDFTSNSAELRKGLEEARINTGGGSTGIPGLGGGPVPVSRPKGTLLYDAVYLAANEKLRNEAGRKAMIILTDGADQGSRSSLEQAIEAAHKADAIIYVLLVVDRGMGFSNPGAMKKLAEQTGGRMIEVGDDSRKLREAFAQISSELRSQYSLGYTPTNDKRDGTYRKIEIRGKGRELKIQARKGYYAIKD